MRNLYLSELPPAKAGGFRVHPQIHTWDNTVKV